jgi:HPt (histidine-containing phosphotransfer) domain-containing protein
MERPLIDPAVFADLQATVGAEFVGELVEAFAGDAPGLVAALRAAWGERAGEPFRRAAHSLKANGLTFGAWRLAEAARALEAGGPPPDAAPLDALAAEVDAAIAALRERAGG